jgi:hypothetical protein
MDNFTLAVIVGDVLMGIAFVMIIVMDKLKAKPTEPVKATGKRLA